MPTNLQVLLAFQAGWGFPARRRQHLIFSHSLRKKKLRWAKSEPAGHHDRGKHVRKYLALEGDVVFSQAAARLA